MSADKDRGIRRQKQKRAKEMKKDARAQHTAAIAQASKSEKSPAKQAA